MTRSRFYSIVAISSFALIAGCTSQPSRVVPPSISPQQAAQTAMAEYDTNGDGVLDSAELEKSPALKSALKDIDKDGDGKISSDEIAKRIEQWQASRIGLMPFSCRVTLDGKPLAEATVTLVPEKFLGSNVQPATGVTGEQGMAMLSVAKDKLADPKLSGVHVGLYRIEVSKQQGGSETIPARYNVNTQLGQEVAQGVAVLQGPLPLNIKSK